MHWIIQDTLYSEEGMETLLATLHRFGIPHDVVTLQNGVLSPDVNPSNPVMVCGTYKLARLARERGWQPGTFLDDACDHAEWVRHWGEKMLNAEAVQSTFRDVNPSGRRVFVRPAGDNKMFDGMVLDPHELERWRDDVIAGRPSPIRCAPTLSGDTEVICAPVREVYRESRFFIVDSVLVAWSTYKVAGVVQASADVDPAARDFAMEAITEWVPARAFALDIASTDKGYRIIEVNCINMSGFYAADVQKLVMEMDSMEA